MSGRRIGYLSFHIITSVTFPIIFSALGAERAAKNSTTGCELFAARARCGNLG